MAKETTIQHIDPHEAITASTSLSAQGMTCASCVAREGRSLEKLPGVLDASVNLATERASAKYDPMQAGISEMVATVSKAGYGAAPRAEVSVASSVDERDDRERAAPRAEFNRQRNMLALSAALYSSCNHRHVLHGDIAQRAVYPDGDVAPGVGDLAAIVGWQFHRIALKNLLHFTADMNTLVSLGTTAVAAHSLYTLATHGAMGLSSDFVGTNSLRLRKA